MKTNVILILLQTNSTSWSTSPRRRAITVHWFTVGEEARGQGPWLLFSGGLNIALWERKYCQGFMFPPQLHATCHNVLLKFSGKSGFKRRSFKEVTKATGNWCERRSRWNMDEIALLSLIESKANAIRWCFHWDCRCLPHRSRSWTIELTSLDSSWWDCCIEWLFLFESIDTSGSLLSIYFILDEWYNWQRKITDTGNPSKTGRAGL